MLPHLGFIKSLMRQLLFIFSENLDSGACQVKNLKREKLSDFLGLTDIFSVKNVVTN